MVNVSPPTAFVIPMVMPHAHTMIKVKVKVECLILICMVVSVQTLEGCAHILCGWGSTLLQWGFRLSVNDTGSRATSRFLFVQYEKGILLNGEVEHCV